MFRLRPLYTIQRNWQCAPYSKVVKRTTRPSAVSSTPTNTDHDPKPSIATHSEPLSVSSTAPNEASASTVTEPLSSSFTLETLAAEHLATLDHTDSTAWGNSYEGLSQRSFPSDIAQVLLRPLDPHDIEVKPDGIVYLPEIKYRRILNRSFGPGGWGLVPRGPHTVTERKLSREYALICLGRFVSQARGEQEYFNPNGLATASEGCKSNALMRCCKDLGIASELWDPAFILDFKKKHCVDEWAVHMERGNKRKLWRRRDRSFEYPWKSA
ncbi:hypothetical protein IWQ61_000179 [Dispira simplex]|nr:hypothetical protein IWQ61_000179 [Dispira simplex]